MIRKTMTGFAFKVAALMGAFSSYSRLLLFVYLACVYHFLHRARGNQAIH